MNEDEEARKEQVVHSTCSNGSSVRGFVARSMTTAPANNPGDCDVNDRVEEESNDDETKDCSTDFETFPVLDGVLAFKFGDVTISTSAKLVLVEPTDEHE